MSNRKNLGDLFVDGDWEGTGCEIYSEVNKSKVYKLDFKIKMNIERMSNQKNVYRVKTRYYFSKDGDIFGITYKKGDLASKDTSFFSKHDNTNGLMGASIWNKKDPSSKTIEYIHLADNDSTTLDYSYNTNNVVNPLNSLLKRYFGNLLFFNRNRKVLVAGNYMLEKK